MRFSVHQHPLRIGLTMAMIVGGLGACSSDAESVDTTVPASGSASVVSSPTSTTASADADADRATVVSFTLEQGGILGFDLDPACVADVVAELSDADAAVLAASTLDTAPDATSSALSDAGEALGNTIENCTVGSADAALVAKAVEQVMSSQGGSGLERSCVEAAFAKLSDEQLQLIVDSATDSTDPRLQYIGSALFACLTPTASTA